MLASAIWRPNDVGVLPRHRRARPAIARDVGPRQIPGMDAWPDAWLVAAVRREPPDAAALDTLVARYWQTLFARCRLLTSDGQVAADLAQDTWLRVLRARDTLDPDRSFPALLSTIATNLWRDRHRAARRAGGLADRHLVSLDVGADGVDVGPGEDGRALRDVVPDPTSLPVDEQVLLGVDLDRALDRLSPRAREVLIARFVDGDSAAEIGRRHGRTEQTVTTWLRDASREVRHHLTAAGAPADRPRSAHR